MRFRFADAAVRSTFGHTTLLLFKAPGSRQNNKLMAHLLKLGDQDDVAVALQTVTAGLYLPDFDVTTSTEIPAGHKLALRAIASGDPVRKFNQIIGFATRPIAAGEHIHTHNLVVADFK